MSDNLKNDVTVVEKFSSEINNYCNSFVNTKIVNNSSNNCNSILKIIDMYNSSVNSLNNMCNKLMSDSSNILDISEDMDNLDSSMANASEKNNYAVNNNVGYINGSEKIVNDMIMANSLKKTKKLNSSSKQESLVFDGNSVTVDLSNVNIPNKDGYNAYSKDAYERVRNSNYYKVVVEVSSALGLDEDMVAGIITEESQGYTDGIGDLDRTHSVGLNQINAVWINKDASYYEVKPSDVGKTIDDSLNNFNISEELNNYNNSITNVGDYKGYIDYKSNILGYDARFDPVTNIVVKCEMLRDSLNNYDGNPIAAMGDGYSPHNVEKAYKPDLISDFSDLSWVMSDSNYNNNSTTQSKELEKCVLRMVDCIKEIKNYNGEPQVIDNKI